MDVTEFNNILNNLLKKINQEQKTVFLLGDFNIDLMHYNEHKPTNEFLDSLASNSYLPYIIQPSRHTSHSRTLINNIFSRVMCNFKNKRHNFWQYYSYNFRPPTTILNLS